MKNKKIIKIILIVISVIIFITILAIVILGNITTYTATITETYDNSIIIEDDSRLIPLSLRNMENPDLYGHLVYKGNNAYGTAKNLIYLNDVCILDINWRKSSKDNLKIGDKIYIVSINAAIPQSSTIPPTLHNVKFIKVLENADLANQKNGIKVQDESLSKEELDKQRQQDKLNWINSNKESVSAQSIDTDTSSDSTIIEKSKEAEKSSNEKGKNVDEIICRFYKADYERLSREVQKNADSMPLTELYSQPYTEELFELIIDIIKNKDITNEEKDALKEFLNMQYAFIKDGSSMKLKFDEVLK